jgi:cytidyltransferase-like protein
MKIVIVSGFFNPLHGGHLDMIEAAEAMGDRLVVIVNNDIQQVMKKDKIILNEQNRARVLDALKYTHEVLIAVDDNPSVTKTIELIAQKYPNDEIIFANGGDRDSEKVIPEAAVCKKYNIQMVFGAGVGKPDSSTRINQALGHAK